MQINQPALLELLGEQVQSECQLTIDRLNATGKWWHVTRNIDGIHAMSCRHAAKVRNRLGSIQSGGIPLWAELKSSVGLISSKGSSKQAFVVHTRANTEIVDKFLAQVIGYSNDDYQLTSLCTDESLDKENSIYGKVNPFNIEEVFQQEYDLTLSSKDIIHIFDESLFLDGGCPDTIMTNIGHRAAAFEMSPSDLFEAVQSLFPKTIRANVSAPCKVWLRKKNIHDYKGWCEFPPAKGPKIGIITGNSTESGLTLAQEVLDEMRELYQNLADYNMPEIVIHSLPEMGLSMEIQEREKQVWHHLLAVVSSMLNQNCKIVTIACNTTIFFEEKIIKLCQQFDAKFISIAQATIPAIKSALAKYQCCSLGMIGINSVANINGTYSGYGKFLRQLNIRVSPCAVDELAFAVKTNGKSASNRKTHRQDKPSAITLRNLINKTLYDEKIIVLALTEASMVYRTMKRKLFHERTIIDSLHELGKRLVWEYIETGYRISQVCQLHEITDINTAFSNLVSNKKNLKD